MGARPREMPRALFLFAHDRWTFAQAPRASLSLATLELLHADQSAAVPGCEERRLWDEVGEVRQERRPRGPTATDRRRRRWAPPSMNLEDLLGADVDGGHCHLAIEAAGGAAAPGRAPRASWWPRLGDAVVRLKAIHFHETGRGLLALVVPTPPRPAPRCRPTAFSSNKDDAEAGALLKLLKHVPHPTASANADKHLDKSEPANREEGDAWPSACSLAGF